MSCELDLSEALSRLGGDSTLLAELARLFLEESPKLLSSLRTAVSGHDARGIESYAHSLKGSIALFGSTQAHGIALAMERKGREHDMAGVDELLKTLEEALTRCTSELRAIA